MSWLRDFMSDGYQYNVLDAINYAVKNGCLDESDRGYIGRIILDNNLKYDKKLMNAIYDIVENCIKYHVYDSFDASIAIKKAIGIL